MEESGKVTATATVSTEPPPPPFFTLDLSPRYAARNFATLADLKEWLVREQKFFSFMGTNPQWRASGSPFSDVAPQTDVYTAALERVQLIEGGDGRSETSENHLRKLHNHLRGNYVEQSQVLMSDDPRAHFIAKLWAEMQPTPRVAAWTLASFIGRQANMNDPVAFEGYTRAMLFNLGYDSAESSSRALAGVQAEYQARIELLDAKRRDLVTATNAAITASSESARERADAFDKSQTERTNAFTKLRDDAASAFDQQQKAVNEQMTLQAPVTYWSRKARRHAYWGGAFAIACIAFLVVYVLLAVSFLPKLIAVLREATLAAQASVAPAGAAAEAQAASSASQSIPVYVGLFAIALIGIWVMRILVRITLSHIHLGTDAKHRSVCVESYLALLSHSDKAVGENERSIILTQLFRPASDGLVRDDAMPPTLFERITSPGR